jgi:endo-1,4-beta-xylanase
MKQEPMKAISKVALASAMTLTLALGATAPAMASSDTEPTIRQLAEQAGILFGSGSVKASESTADDRPANYFSDPRYGQVLAEQFNSLSPENEFKWNMVQPQEGVFDFEGLDRMVAFAEEHDMEVKAHSGISRSFNPDYLVAKTDPAEFREAMVDHFNTIMQRYTGKMDRWDVVTEMFTTFGGEGLEHNLFYDRLGPGYVAEAFRIAHAADPTAKLFINENMVEYYPAKRQELYDLVAGMVADGVPVHGVALQMHETFAGPTPGVITDIVNDYRALGLEVTIAELDVHTYDPISQAQIYGDVVAEALAAGITDISTWGFTDKHLYTWLPGAKPTIFDEEFNPKPAYFAVRDALQSFVYNDRAPGKGKLSTKSGSSNGLHDGNYTVTMNLDGTPGSYYRLYENDILIAAQQLNAVHVKSQSVETTFTEKPAGTYTYRAELINSQGVTETTTTKVKVKDSAPGKPDNR